MSGRAVTVVCAGVSPVGRRLFAVELHMAISPLRVRLNVKKKHSNSLIQLGRKRGVYSGPRPAAPELHTLTVRARRGQHAAPGRRSPRAPCGCRLCPGNGSRTTLGIRAYAIVECSAEATTAHWAARALCAAACVPRGLSLLSRCGRPLFARGCTPRRRESDLRGVERESHRQSAPVTRRGRRLGRHAPTSRRLRYQLSKWSSSVLSDVNCHWFRSSGAPAARAGGDAASAHLAGAPQRSMAAA